MFLRCNRRLKDGKTHEYWSVVENRRLADGRVVQRQVLNLGEVNASQREAWRKTIEVHDEGPDCRSWTARVGSVGAAMRHYAPESVTLAGGADTVRPICQSRSREQSALRCVAGLPDCAN